MKIYEGLKISSPFGERENPMNPNEKHFHRGIDFIPDHTLNTYAGFSGQVRKVSEGKLEGKYLQIFTKLNEVPFYINTFHLRFINKWIGKNYFVRPTDFIAIAGSTGNSTGIHIHYEIFSYRLDAKFIQDLKKKVKFHIVNGSKKRIFFDPFELYYHCIANNIYV